MPSHLPQKIVIITTTQFSLNPRMVKEADALTEEGYDVTVLHAYWNKWGADFDKLLIPTKKWKAICIGGDPENKPRLYFLSRVIHKIAKVLNQKISPRILPDVAIVRASYFLKRAAKKYDADLYIGHNPGALPATVKAAKTNHKLCGFDAEDFHRYELSDNVNDPDVKLRVYLENKYFPQLDYLLASSPLIGSAYRQLFPNINPEVVLNVFPTNHNIPAPVFKVDKPLKLFWFSQTIGVGRGLEETIEALKHLKGNSFELHLLGYLNAETKTSFIDPLIEGTDINVHFHCPIPSDQIIHFASQFDIGLALERNEPTNRGICLTNKIFTYLQAGLAIVASDTKAQHQLIDQYPAVGKVYLKDNVQAMADIFLYYHQNRKKLFETKNAALKVAHEELNWENEKKKLIHLVNQTLERN